ncbi:MAG: tRNA 2-selenouridine(34) synthase MnmH [Bacteroidetes bacterium]|nr:tRNA 2-selenouridine(34) synthase MnmH [Bacteroidota bacterium]
MNQDPKIITIADYFLKFSDLHIIDVRSPGEFEKGHIPQANSIPLFTDEERAKVGTAYTRQSKEIAMNIGLKIVKPKLRNFIDESRKIAPEGRVVVHCWRGGMRSASFARHLTENGFSEVFLIEGGYKHYRRHVLQFFEHSFHLYIVGGYTGSGKTRILEILREKAQQVIDLEGIAHHRGSAFGGISMGKQPSVEQFENNLYEEMRHLDLDQPIWLEDESHHIGSVFVPKALFDQMEASRVYFLNIPREERAKYLVNEYSNLDREELAVSIKKIAKRLGFDQAKYALEFLGKEDFYNVAMTTLKYYDKFYLRGLSLHDKSKIRKINIESVRHADNADLLLKVVTNES